MEMKLDNAVVQQIALEKFKMCTRVEIPNNCLDYGVEEDLLNQKIIHYMTLQFVGLTKEATAKYPSTWWQHFKERWFPKCLKKRFPVKYTEVRVEVKRAFPDLALDKKVDFYMVEKHEVDPNN